MTPLSKTEIALHWIVGLGMIAIMAVGIYIENTEARSLMPLHKSFGIALFAFILLRVVVRMRKGWPETVSKGKAWEHILARVVHWVLIIGTLVMPISGMLGSIFGGRGLSLFNLELLTASLGADGRPVAINETLANFAGGMHGLAAKVLIAAILLHVAGALKHSFADRDATLRRMLGKSAT